MGGSHGTVSVFGNNDLGLAPVGVVLLLVVNLVSIDEGNNVGVLLQGS